MMDKPTILVSRTGRKIPFDIQSKRVIFYKSIDELKIKLSDALNQYLKNSPQYNYSEKEFGETAASFDVGANNDAAW
jgi:hypothetical protein